MSTSRFSPIKAVAALAFTIGLVAAGTASVTAASQPVHTGTTSVGKVLVNAKGKTIYLFAADTAGKSSCNGACAQAWPPVLATAKTLGHSVDVKAKLSVIKRSDGKTQLAVNGLPAYTYSGDTAAGQAHGQGMNASGGLWWVIAPSGAPIKSTGSSSSGSAPGGATSPGGTYDYY
ncbi:MAG: hypothetical protein Q7L55_11420 [Actinomycetota bacterium]|nr:hypothetical protein [Actinomycetota bacterium]